MKTLLVVAGDGIGPEVTSVALAALERLVPLEVLHGLAGRRALDEHCRPVAPGTEETILDQRLDGVLFGATATRPGEASAVLRMRALVAGACNVRPARALLPGARPCDVTVYRELTEDLYVQQEAGGGTVAVARRPITRAATERFAALALDHVGSSRPAVVAHKATVLPCTDGLFLSACRDIAADRGLVLEDRLVDALAHDLVLDPTGPLAVLAPNLYGDILSDVTAALAGGLGVSPSLTLGGGPPLVEPVHGTADRLAGTGRANPAAALLSATLLLDHWGEREAADRLEDAVVHTLSDRAVATPDVGGTGTTETFARSVLTLLETPPEVPA